MIKFFSSVKIVQNFKSYERNSCVNFFLILQAVCLFLFLANVRIFFTQNHVNVNKNRYFADKVKSREDFDKYRQIHENIIDGLIKPRKIVFSGDIYYAGYANKVYSMLSAFVIAILTDSAFICEWPDIGNYIEEPLFMSFHKFRQPNEFNSKYKKNEIYFDLRSKDAWNQYKTISVSINQTIPTSFTKFFYNKIEPFFFEICLNPIYFDKLLEYKLVTPCVIKEALNVHQNFSKYTEQEKQDTLFKIGFEVGGNLLNKYWIPKQRILENINKYSQVFASNFVIGFQIRTEFLDLKSKDLEAFWSCAFEIENNLVNNSKQVKWYVSSDKQKIIDQMVYEFDDKIISGFGKIGHVNSQKSAYERAILDIELLSKCDELIFTGGSTFGFLASMKQQKLAYFVNGYERNPKCARFSFSGPTFSIRPDNKASVF